MESSYLNQSSIFPYVADPQLRTRVRRDLLINNLAYNRGSTYEVTVGRRFFFCINLIQKLLIFNVQIVSMETCA